LGKSRIRNSDPAKSHIQRTDLEVGVGKKSVGGKNVDLKKKTHTIPVTGRGGP
jgi:hypothetical protein